MIGCSGIEKIIRENAFGQKKKKPRLKFNPGLALIDLRTTGPRVKKLHARELSRNQSILGIVRLANRVAV